PKPQNPKTPKPQNPSGSMHVVYKCAHIIRYRLITQSDNAQLRTSRNCHLTERMTSNRSLRAMGFSRKACILYSWYMASWLSTMLPLMLTTGIVLSPFSRTISS
ncbi:MAG: hypothetical protein P4M11_14135, partial [Candidatus Pacebacteria bacterium]|nr:hypothetical protein [Candidatus Paceibacterota bacterium]